MIFPIASAFLLCCVCVLAYKRASRGRISHSIKWLIWLYSASFLFATLSEYHILKNNIDYIGENQLVFHLGVRPTLKMGHPGKWGFINGKQVTLETALGMLSR